MKLSIELAEEDLENAAFALGYAVSAVTFWSRADNSSDKSRELDMRVIRRLEALFVAIANAEPER